MSCNTAFKFNWVANLNSVTFLLINTHLFQLGSNLVHFVPYVAGRFKQLVTGVSYYMLFVKPPKSCVPALGVQDHAVKQDTYHTVLSCNFHSWKYKATKQGPREAVESPSLVIIKACLEGALSKSAPLQNSTCFEQVIGAKTCRGPFPPELFCN